MWSSGKNDLQQVWEGKRRFSLAMKRKKWGDNGEEVGIGVTMCMGIIGYLFLQINLFPISKYKTVMPLKH